MGVMEMTEEEIVRKYKSNPKPGTISIIADLNGCKEYEIKRILDKNGFDIPKPGRKKKTQADKTIEKINELEMQNFKRSESSKNDISQNESNKNESLPVDKSLPEVVVSVIEEELERINVRIMNICDEADALSARREELKRFLKGE